MQSWGSNGKISSMKLYSYWRSSAAYRVRIALNLKDIECEYDYVHLVKNDQQSPDYKSKNPQGLVPALELSDGRILTQSLAIIDYLDQSFDGLKLLPNDPFEKARIQAFAQAISCDIHPVNNLRILNYLSNEFAIEDQQKATWYRHWVMEGFQALETSISTTSNGKFCFGETPSLADICLIPQIYNANRFKVDMTAYPTLSKINDHCMTLAAFKQASPEAQQDAT